MTVMELNASLFKELSTIASDEDLMRDVIAYIRRIRRNRTKAALQEEAINQLLRQNDL